MNVKRMIKLRKRLVRECALCLRLASHARTKCLQESYSEMARERFDHLVDVMKEVS